MGQAKNGAATTAVQRSGSDDSEDDSGPIEIIKEGSNDVEGGLGALALQGGDKPLEEEVFNEEPEGKEDRPVFDMFSAANLSGAAGAGPGGEMAGKGRGQGMSYLGDDGGGDQVCVCDWVC